MRKLVKSKYYIDILQTSGFPVAIQKGVIESCHFFLNIIQTYPNYKFTLIFGSRNLENLLYWETLTT